MLVLVLALTACGELHHAAFKHLQQTPAVRLHGQVCCDGIVCTGFSGNLIEFIEIDDAMLGFFNILVSCVIKIVRQLRHLPPTTPAGEAGRHRYSKGDVEQFGKIGKCCLAPDGADMMTLDFSISVSPSFR